MVVKLRVSNSLLLKLAVALSSGI